MKEKLIGQVAVDSGQLMLCDPCYVDSQWKHEEFTGVSEGKENFSYAACCNATLSKERYGQLNFAMGHAGVAVAFSTAMGDGYYPVYANYNEHDELVSVTVKF